MNKLKWLIAILVVTAGVMVCSSTIDNDSWYILAEGREIVENGLYYEDQLSMHEGLDITVQNYGFAVIFYLIYSALGPVGVYIGVLILNLVLCYLIYKICMLISNKNVNLSFIIMILTDLLLARWFVVTRAQMVSYVIIMLLIYLLELYIKTGKSKVLWWVPLLSLVQINIHASLWPMLLIVMVVYMIGKDYKKKPLVLALLGLVAMGFLNPYGVGMMTYLVTSFGVSEANVFINEMKGFRPLADGYNILLYAAIVGVMVAYIYGRSKNIRLRWLILLFGFLALGINNNRGMSHLILVLLFPLAAVYKNVMIEKLGSRKFRWIAAAWAGVLAVSLIVAIAVLRIPEAIDGPCEALIATMDKIDDDVGDRDKAEVKVFVNYDHGGFVEYRGYKAYIDPRMEVFIKANNHKEDIFKEYFYFVNNHGGLKKEEEFLEKYNFDYLLTFKEMELYELETDKYALFYEDTDSGIRLWKKA